MVSSEASIGEACSPKATRQYGITKPISLSGSSGSDLQRSRELEEFLVSAGLYESEQESALREEVLAQIDQESGHSSPSNARSSHEIGRLGKLLRENDEFFELVSSKFLSDTRYTIGVHVVATRILLACPSTSMYPHDIEGVVLENIKRWAMEDMIKSSGEECHSKVEAAGQEASDAEMLKTYATRILPLALNGNSPVVEDVLTCGLSAKLMRFLRIRVLGETSANQKDITLGPESRQAIGSSSIRAREDIKGRMRHVADVTRPDFSRLVEEALPEDQNVDKDIEKGDESSSHVEKRAVQWTISMYIPLVLRLHVQDFEVKRVTVTKQVSLFQFQC